jgi:hypothetical protein
VEDTNGTNVEWYREVKRGEEFLAQRLASFGTETRHVTGRIIARESGQVNTGNCA